MNEDGPKRSSEIAKFLDSTALTSIFTVKTPVPGLPEVSLRQDTWDRHIVPNHPYMAGRQELVRVTVMAPTVVVQGTSNPEYLVFVNHEETSSGGSPLTVMINPEIQIIVTSLYHRSFRVYAPESVIWQR